MFHLQPVFKDYLWGGDKLKKFYGKKSDLPRIAESWELSTHKDGLCRIKDSGYNEQTLLTYIKEQGKMILGSHCKTEDTLPILIKLIDAADDLSVQVHPDDVYATRHENDLGKAEMWYILDAKEDAKLILGFKEDITREMFWDAVCKGTLTDKLNYVPVKKGDCFFIPPGTIHAIGKGIILVEVQQSSNVTYRVFDYDRVEQYGQKRPLHLEKAMDVLSFEKLEKVKTEYKMQEYAGFSKATLVKCVYFTSELIDVFDRITLNADEQSFHSLLFLEGAFTLVKEDFCKKASKGDSFFIPAHFGTYTVRGKGKFILTTV